MSSQKTRIGKKDSAAKGHSSPQKRPPQASEGAQAESIRLEQAIEEPSAATPADLLALQGRHGNQAVSGLIQTKLRVGPARDSYEQEADRVADRALDHPVQGGVQRQVDLEEEEIQAKPLADSVTPLVQREGLEEEEEELQAAPTAQRTDEGFEAGDSVEQRLASLRGSGGPLPDELRADMERRFGTGFGAVRVHTDAESDALNRDLRARAFTHRSDIYFSAGQFEPESERGKHLLAHELTHVVQQTGGGPQASSQGAREQRQASVPSTRGEPAVQRVTIEELDDEEEQTQSQDSQLPMLADKPWSEIEKEKTQSQGSQLPMLADKPWSEIEKERSPIWKLLQSEYRSRLPQMSMPDLSKPIQMPSQSLQSNEPLMLTDKPWSEMQKEKEEAEDQPSQEPVKQKGTGPKPVPEKKLQIGAKKQVQQGGGSPQISDPKALTGQEMTGGSGDRWAENLMREHNIDPKDWEVLGQEQRSKLVSDLTSGNPKRARRTLNKAKSEREGKTPGAWQTWKAGWGAFFKETIPSKLSALTPTSTQRAQQRAIANRRKSLGGQVPAQQPAKSNIGTIEQYLKERKTAKEEKAKAEKSTDTASKGGISGLDAGIKIGELQGEVKALRAKVEELERRV